LVQNGAAVDAANSEGRTSLIVASQEGYHAIASFLLVRGASPNVCDSDGWTAL
ncbi:hypothetical protein BDV98DRAFT_468764, partial [Pterulicium gracile]